MFEGKTILERLNTKEYQMRSTLSFENDKYKVVVAQGFVTDGASIPRLFWGIIGCPLRGKYVGSAIIHDGLYASHRLSKSEADKFFLEMMKHNGVGVIRRYAMYYAVKIFGRSSYRKSEDVVHRNKKVVKVIEKVTE